jgi:hypothetical protein
MQSAHFGVNTPPATNPLGGVISPDNMGRTRRNLDDWIELDSALELPGYFALN